MSYPPFAQAGPLLALSTVGPGGQGDAEQQMRQAFANLRSRLRDAGLSPEEVGSVIVNIADHAQRAHINGPWLELFPDENDRPARRTTKARLPEGTLVQLQALGVPGHRRQRLEPAGAGHRDPIPPGVRLGDVVFSSALNGPGEAVAGQVQLTFENAGRLLEAAGGSLADVGHMWVFMRERGDLQALVDGWLQAFPRDGDRPARKTIGPYELMGDQLVQAQLIAVLGGGRTNYEIPGVGHHDPIPMVARVGPLLFSSGVAGIDPASGQLADGLEAQVRLAFRNLRTLLEVAGGSLRDVGYLTCMLHGFEDEPAFEAAFHDAFGEHGPAVHVTLLGLPAQDMRVQLHAIAGW